MEIRRETREVKLESHLWLPIIFSWEMPRSEFTSKCSRVVQRYTMYRPIKRNSGVPRIDLHLLVGVEGFPSECTN